MDLNRLAIDLSAGLEGARKHARDVRAAYIGPRHLLMALLQPKGALARMAATLEVDAARALDTVRALPAVADQIRLEPGRQPIAGRALRDLMDRSFAITDQGGGHTVGVMEVVLAAIEGGDDGLGAALRDSGFTRDVVRAALDSDVVMQPADESPGASGSELERFSRDLTQAARNGKLMPLIGRSEELRHVIQTLLRKSKSNPVLVGDPGTGKTAIVEGLARRIVAGDVPESLKGCRLVALDLTALVAGAKYRGEFEERIKAVVDEVRGRDDLILFLDEIHTLVGAGGNAGGMDAANILKPALSRGELRVIGATTFDEYRESIEKDGALARRFERVVCPEPDDGMVLTMLRGAKHRYEEHHGVEIGEEALLSTVKLARRHLRDRFFPDKAFDILDEAAANLRMQRESKPTEIDELERRVFRMQGEVEMLTERGETVADELSQRLAESQERLAALLTQWEDERAIKRLMAETRAKVREREAEVAEAEEIGDAKRAASHRLGELRGLEHQLSGLQSDLERLQQGGMLVALEIGPGHVAEVIGRRARVPVARMLESDKDRLLNLEERLGGRVIGQDEAVSTVAEAARRMRANLRKRPKPASFLFVGPTGVGKTELAKGLAEALFDDESALIRIDMAEYKDSGSVSGLIGARPGLVGYDEGGRLTEQVRRNPSSVVLFDEIEKAHPEVMDILLGVLDEGRLSDAKGRLCDFTNTIVLLTSNLGVKEANEATDDLDARREIIVKVVQSTLRPELFNRLSGVVPFNALPVDVLKRIVSLKLEDLRGQLRSEHGAQLEVDEDALDVLAEMSYDPAYGARPVERTLEEHVVSGLSYALISGAINEGDTVRVVRVGADEVTILAGPAEEVEDEVRKMREEASGSGAEVDEESEEDGSGVP